MGVKFLCAGPHVGKGFCIAHYYRDWGINKYVKIEPDHHRFEVVKTPRNTLIADLV
jgi:hypothetical protein